MNLISNILFATMILVVSCVYGQETQSEKKKTFFSAKLYAVSTFERGSALTINNNPTIIIPRSFSPTITWGKEYGNYNEVELTDIGYTNSFGRKLFKFGTRYSYNWRIYSKSDEARFSYYIGTGVGANYNKSVGSSSSIYDSYYFNNNYRDFKLYASIIPRVNIKIGKKMYLDVNTAYDVLDYSWEKFKNGGYVHKSNSGSAFPEKFTVNVGIAIKF